MPSLRTDNMRLAFALLATTIFISKPSQALAFGEEGHEVIALVAQQYLNAEAKTKIEALLALEPGETLVSIANWADRTRNKTTAAWHYVNMPRDSNCEYVAARDCPDGACVVGALEAQVKRLTSGGSDVERLKALKFVVHLTGDLHQPLHAGFADDRGGNTYQLQAFGKGTNLHALWDTALIRDIDPDPETLASKLIAGSDVAPATTFDPVLWARESCGIVSQASFYPDRRPAETYLRTYKPIIERRLYLAGVRLAATLNQVLATPPSR